MTTRHLIGITLLIILTAVIALGINHERIYLFWTLEKISPLEKSVLDDCLRCHSLTSGKNSHFGLDIKNKTCRQYYDMYCDCLPAVYTIPELRAKAPTVKYTKKDVKQCIEMIKREYKNEF